MSLKICEIFKSIDGEVNGFGGAGEQTTFIRLQGCNLNCDYCDTKYARSSTSGDMTTYPLGELFSKLPPDLDDSWQRKVTITGGEPLLQAEVWNVVDECLKRHIRVTIETNGSRRIPREYMHIGMIRFVVDWKLPSAKLPDLVLYNSCNYQDLTSTDVIKFVVLTRDDYMKAKNVVDLYKNWRARNVLSIGLGTDGFLVSGRKELIEHILKEADERFQLQLQLHKMLQARWRINVR